MSKTISYKGRIPIGQQQKINLKTINGKTAYQITKFQAIAGRPGVDAGELVVKVYRKSQLNNVDPEVNFDDNNLLAVSFYKSHSNNVYAVSDTIIFDNAMFNQDIFVTMDDAEGGTDPGNYYIELEAVSINDIAATQLTLKSLRTIASQWVNNIF